MLSLTLMLCLVNVVLVGLLWDAASFWRSMLIQWLINHSPFLAPCLIVDVAAFLYFTKEVRFTITIKSPKIRVLSIIVLMEIPLLFAAILLYLWLAAIL